MKKKGWLLVGVLALLAIGAGWLWRIKPREADMTALVPANSLLYLEVNNPLEVVQALENTEAWKVIDDLAGASQKTPRNAWFERFIGWTGIGPVDSVILARSQVAVVVTGLGATEDSDTLRIRPEAALVIETKTSERRIRPAVEEAVKKLAELTYGKPAVQTITIDGVNFTEWVAPEGSRQIVTVIYGSLVIIGNTRKTVQDCLAVSQGRQPSLREDAELSLMRRELGGVHALSFGYVPSANSARLLSIAVPLLIGRAPANSEFQRLITSGASKVIGSIGWSSRSFMTGIEDRFLISLRPAILGRLKPNFVPVNLSNEMQQVFPDNVYSISYYKFENPDSTWQALKTSVSSQIDALSAMVFTSLLNSSLSSSGIEDPERFLAAVNSEIATFRMDQSAERSLLVARVRDQAKLRELLSQTLRVKAANEPGRVETLEDSAGEHAAGFLGDLIVMGPPADVRKYTVDSRHAVRDPSKLRKMSFFVPFSSMANIVTYADDRDRVRRFASALLAVKGMAPAAGNRMDQMLEDLPYSATETTLAEQGIQRKTFSPLGQFSTLLPLLVPAERVREAPDP